MPGKNGFIQAQEERVLPRWFACGSGYAQKLAIYEIFLNGCCLYVTGVKYARKQHFYVNYQSVNKSKQKLTHKLRTTKAINPRRITISIQQNDTRHSQKARHI